MKALIIVCHDHPHHHCAPPTETFIYGFGTGKLDTFYRSMRWSTTYMGVHVTISNGSILILSRH